MKITIKNRLPDVLILCGGKGTRFKEVSNNLPKSLALINGEPLISIILKHLIKQNCKRIVLGTGYKSEYIKKYVGTKKDADYVISDEKNELGTAGAIKNALPLLVTDDVIVINGDTIVNYNINKLFSFHKKINSDLTILLSASLKNNDGGNVLIDNENKILAFEEKKILKRKSYFNCGVYVFKKSIIENMDDGYSSLEIQFIPEMLKNNFKLYGYQTKSKIYDIGTPERYNKIKNIPLNC